MSNSAHQNWQYLGGNGFTGSFTTYGGGGTPISGRDGIDTMRMGLGKTPAAEYPDGYLGTMRSRRDDRGIPTDTVLDSLKNRQNQRSYQRGVHKGERVDPGQYFWPEGLEPDRRSKVRPRLINNDGGMVMMVKRETPEINLVPPPALVNDGKANIRSNDPVDINVQRAYVLSHLKPGWK